MPTATFSNYDVHLLDRRTGERAVFSADFLREDTAEPFSDWIWREGNFACDCNRALFFARALKRDDPERPLCTQGRVNRYIVEKIVRVEDGATVYGEPVPA